MSVLTRALLQAHVHSHLNVSRMGHATTARVQPTGSCMLPAAPGPPMVSTPVHGWLQRYRLAAPCCCCQCLSQLRVLVATEAVKVKQD